MKKKFIDLLKSKHKSVGVSQKAFDRVAEYFEKNGQLTEELSDEDLTKLVDGAEPLLIMAKAESDSKLEDFKKKNNPQEKPTDEERKDDTPEWAKTLMNEVKALKTEKVVSSRKSSYESTALKGVDEKTKARELANFDRLTKDMTDEEYAEWETEQAAFHQESVQEKAVENLGGLQPINGDNATGKPSDKELDAIVNDMKI